MKGHGPQRGFTLIEVVIAMFVAALGIGALLTTLGNSADTVGRLRDISMAQWVALNRVSEVRLAGVPPTVGTTQGTTDQDFGGKRWRWQQEVSDPGMAGILRIDVRVAPLESSAPAAAAPTEGKAPAFPALATVHGFFGTAVGPPSGIDPDWSLAGAGSPGPKP